MEVQEIITKEFEIISSSDKILQAAKRMKRLSKLSQNLAVRLVKSCMTK